MVELQLIGGRCWCVQHIQYIYKSIFMRRRVFIIHAHMFQPQADGYISSRFHNICCLCDGLLGTAAGIYNLKHWFRFVLHCIHSIPVIHKLLFPGGWLVHILVSNHSSCSSKSIVTNLWNMTASYQLTCYYYSLSFIHCYCSPFNNYPLSPVSKLSFQAIQAHLFPV